MDLSIYIKISFQIPLLAPFHIMIYPNTIRILAAILSPEASSLLFRF
jgi:hypothetical protein